MPSDTELIRQRNKYVNKVYAQLSKQGYTHKAICNKMTDHGIFLKPRTIYAIVSGEYDKPKDKTAS